MTPRMALIGALVCAALMALGLYLALGPWALVGFGAVGIVVFLLVPTADQVSEQDGG